MARYDKEALELQEKSVDLLKEEKKLQRETLADQKLKGLATQATKEAILETNRLIRLEEAALKDILELRRLNNADLVEEIGYLDELAGKYDAMGDSLDFQHAKLEAQKESIVKQNELIVEQLKNGQIAEDLAKDLLNDLKEQTEQLEEQEEHLAKQKDAFKSISKTVRGMLGFSEKVEASFSEQLGIAIKQKGVMGTIKGIWKDIGGFTGVIDNLGEKATEGLVAIFKIAMDLAFAMDNATSSFKQSTGAADKYAATIEESWQQSKHLAVTADEVAAANKALYTSFTNFTFASDEQRLSLSNTANELSRLGVTNEQFAKSLQVSTKAYGMSTEEAQSFSKELTVFARDIGVETGIMADQFAQVGPQLSKMGEQGIKAFKELARVSKISGLEMSKVLALTNQFDTFEGAAKTVGSLNALLGGDFVNSMDLMMATDPAERFGMIRDSLDAAGKSFETMGYYERLAITEALGLKDVNELAMIMSGNFDQLAGSTEVSVEEQIRLAEIAKTNLSLQQNFQAVLAELAPNLQWMMESMKGVVIWMSESETLLKNIIPAMVTLKAISLGLGFAQLFQAASGQAATFSLKKFGIIAVALAGVFFLTKYTIGSFGNFVQGMYALSVAFLAIGIGAKIGGKGLIHMVKPALAIGAAMTGILLGIQGAVTGFAALADSMSKLNKDQLAAFTTVLIGFGIGLAIMMGILAALVFTGVGPAAVGLLLAFGAAVLMIGAGVGLAAAGIGFMAEGFATLFGAIDLAKVLSLTLFFGTLGILAPLLFIAAGAMAYIALAVGGLGFAMKFLDAEKLAPLAQFVTGLSVLAQTAGGLSTVAREIRNIVDAVDDLPETKAVQVSHLVTTTAASAIAAKKAGVTAGTLGGGGVAAAGGSLSGKVPLNVTLNIKFDYDDLQTILKNDFVTKKEFTDAIVNDGG